MNSLEKLLTHSNSNKQGVFAELLNAAAAEMAPTLSFPTKDDYLAWVKDWKVGYAHLTAEIRLHKVDNRGARLPEKIERREKAMARYNAEIKAFGGRPAILNKACDACSHVWSATPYLQRGARYMLALRKAGKLAAAAATVR